jgi:hypothetical protein
VAILFGMILFPKKIGELLRKNKATGVALHV